MPLNVVRVGADAGVRHLSRVELGEGGAFTGGVLDRVPGGIGPSEVDRPEADQDQKGEDEGELDQRSPPLVGFRPVSPKLSTLCTSR